MAEMTCPNCGHKQPQAAELGKCGVIVDNYLKREREKRKQPPPQPPAPLVKCAARFSGLPMVPSIDRRYWEPQSIAKC